MDTHDTEYAMATTMRRVVAQPARPVVPDRAWVRPALLAAIGSAALAVGILVYLADRTASRAVLIPDIALFTGHHPFGVLGQWLPSFLHPFAFSLFTAAALKPGAAARNGAC